MNIDIEIYLTTLKRFFTDNPKSKEDLFGFMLDNEDLFYVKLEEQAINNFEKGGDPTLTRRQMLDIVDNLFQEQLSKGIKEVAYDFSSLEPVIQETKFGPIFLN